jgi:hypothetical protein
MSIQQAGLFSSTPTESNPRETQEKKIGVLDRKTYSLARKIFEGMGLILLNIATLGTINIELIRNNSLLRQEYDFVFSGYSKIKYNDTIFTGNFKTREFKEGKLCGKGKVTFPDGRVLEGEFKEGKLHGKGKAILPDGGVYEGKFKEGKMQGKGMATFPDGRVYQGEFKEGKADGKGILFNPDKKVYKVEIQEGKVVSKKEIFCWTVSI